ncbi:STAS domain-containing protein [Oceanobacter kriegii]|uniref:STAS domain-containing protein n=1 Tax=Oceanobacter kriegii TaxID=64972 RepID=UPI00040DA949|nr:STAS domain-containing protein [Oceanobacter kriegii]
MTSLESLSAQNAALNGTLNAISVVALVDEGKQLIANAGSNWNLDMAAVEQVSSAAVALLLEWLRAAQAADVAMTVSNVPESLLPIIQVSELEPVFAGVLLKS